MNFTLLRKELSELRLCVLLVGLVYGMDVFYLLGTDFPDMPTDNEKSAADEIIPTLFFGILVGITVLSRERDQQTQSFLDALPVSRLGVFLHKALAALVIVLFERSVSFLLGLFYAWVSLNSLSKPIAGVELIAQAGLSVLLEMTVVGAAVLFSFSRQWFPLIAGLALLTIVWFRTTSSPMAAWLDTPTLLSPVINEGILILPWKQIGGHAFLAVVAWTCSAIAYQWQDGIVSRWMDQMSAWKFAGWITNIGRAFAILVWIAAIGFMASNENQDSKSPEEQAAGRPARSGSKAHGGSSAMDGFAKFESEHYELIFKESQRETVDQLAWSIDEVHEQARAYFQHPPAPSARIVVDVASAVSSHASGQANWTKIRVPLALATSNQDFLQTLRHETAHVFIEQLSNGRATDHFNAMRMFHEGVATAVQLEGYGDTSLTERQRMNRWAAGTDSRGRVPFKLLCDNEALNRERDSDVVYPLGYVVANALLDAGGPTLPRRMLEALRDSRLPPGVMPTELWRILLQKCGTSLDLVIASYETRLDLLGAREKTFVDGLPRLTGTVTVDGAEIVIRAEQKTSPNPTATNPAATMVCMVSQNRVLDTTPEYMPMQEDGSFRIPRLRVSGTKLRYLLGWSTADSANVIFEPWSESVLTNAN